VPNWSEGRNQEFLQEMLSVLEDMSPSIQKHYLGGDYDHNRTVSAFSGHPASVRRALFRQIDVAFRFIDLRQHQGVHPRIGALDVCPFVVLAEAEDLKKPSLSEACAVAFSRSVAREIAERYEVPVFLYEKSAREGHPKELPVLRKGGFEGLVGKDLSPDYGPHRVHPRWGAVVVGVRDWLVAVNVLLEEKDAGIAKAIAREIRALREREPIFRGVRALGLPLASRGITQVSLNITQVEATGVDPIIRWVEERAHSLGTRVIGCELVGVIRRSHLPSATLIPVSPEQVVEG
jgi:glutamate formiminotransferase